MEGASEFLSRQIPLSQSVEILEKFEQSNPVFLHDLFDLLHKVVVLLNSIKVSEFVSECWLSTGGVPVYDVFEAVSVSKEFSVFDRVVLIPVDQSHSIYLIFADLETQSVENLSKNFGAHLKVA